MPHIQVIQAQSVLADRANYPEVIVSQAMNIVEWSEGKRTAMQWLWKHRQILHFWLKAREGKTKLEQNRTATRKLAAEISRDQLNDFHKAYNYLGRTEISMGMEFAIFDGLLKVLHCTDIVLMHRYFACVNAKRIDGTLEPVSFLRWGNGTRANEVLAWRLLRLCNEQVATKKNSAFTTKEN